MSRKLWRVWGCLLVMIAGGQIALAQEASPPVLADGLPPQEAAEAMTVPEGFRVKLAAGEPAVHQPIGFTIDHKGRLWVAEAYTYPNRAADGKGFALIGFKPYR